MLPEKLEAGFVVVECDFVPRRRGVATCAIVVRQKLCGQLGPVNVLVTIDALYPESFEMPCPGTEVT